MNSSPIRRTLALAAAESLADDHPNTTTAHLYITAFASDCILPDCETINDGLSLTR
ncbi:hypothetical protein [Roseiconus nitratireducens]|uniref:hypothetical protein n=1 Tax=Roseiconus nitratireducens TaxID=2605748 RepID=UPI00137588D7|nr:hypothetical protein [Roseiconus nitratireducens]